MPRVDDDGLIHADLHLGNALFQRGDVKLIDFDDCGTGPRLYEVAVALWELRDGPDYPAFRDALLAGYRAHRDVDVTHLDDYIAAAAGRLRPLVHRHGAGQPSVRRETRRRPPLVAGDARPGGDSLSRNVNRRVWITAAEATTGSDVLTW